MKYILAVALFIVVSSVVKKLFKKSDKSEELYHPEIIGEKDENKKEESSYVPLEQEKLEALFRKYNCNSDDILYLELYEKKENDEELTEDELLVLNNPELKDLIPMAEILNAEINFRDREKKDAIHDIMHGIYIQNKNNPVKLIINFVLTFFEIEYRKNFENADKILIESFPLMHGYIKSQILGLNFTQLPTDRPFNSLDAFQEFIYFTAKLFIEKYPLKEERNSEIRRNFPKISEDIIAIIDKN